VTFRAHGSRTPIVRAVLLAVLAGIGSAAPAVSQQHDFVAQDVWRTDPYAASSLHLPGDAWSTMEPARDQAEPGLLARIRSLTRGRTQLEGGYTFIRETAGGTRIDQHAVPDLLLRYGLTDRLELRLGWPGYVSTGEAAPEYADSSGDVLRPNVGFMLDLWGQRGIQPQTALLASVPITLEGNPFALDSLQPLTQLLYRWWLGQRMGIGGSTGMALFDVAGDHFVQLQQTVSLDYLLTPRLGTFLEWQMLVDHGSLDDGAQHMLGGGLSYLLTDRWQLTWRSAFQLNERAPDFLTDLRFAYRF
jgi:hypothetical protein